MVKKTELIPDSAIRTRCVQAAARAMMRGPAQNETPAVFASFVFGLGNFFYAMAKSEPAAALAAIDAAAEAMVNAKGPTQPTEAFGKDVATVAEQFYRFATGAQATIGEVRF